MEKIRRMDAVGQTVEHNIRAAVVDAIVNAYQIRSEANRLAVLRAITSEYMKVLVNTNSVGHFTEASLLPHIASHLREMQGVPESIDDITPRFIQSLFIKNK